MAIPILMPKQGQSVETCIISKWLKKTGDQVAKGDILLSYETDKAAFDLESPDDGTLLAIFFDDGAEVPVLVNIGAIGQPGESFDEFRPEAPSKSTSDTANSTAGEPQTPVQKTTGQSAGENVSVHGDQRIKISPRAKKMAQVNNIDYSNIKGSGPNGRIVVSDIENAMKTATVHTDIHYPVASPAAVAAPTVSPVAFAPVYGNDFVEKPLTNIRKLIAKTMMASIHNSAQLTHHLSADVRGILAGRRKNKADVASGNEKFDITLNDMVCWCVVRALEKFPEVNSHFLGESIRTFNRVHLGLAVDTPRGLMVPAIRNADGYHLRRLSAELKAAAEACRKGAIDPELIQSTAASFTVSNLGNYGVEMFTPIINLPQAAILGVCTITRRPADLGNNTFGFVPYMGLSLTYDHRAVDGGPATLFLKEIKTQIENFNYEKVMGM